jgi:hypothetical protein
MNGKGPEAKGMILDADERGFHRLRIGHSFEPVALARAIPYAGV